MRRIDDEQATAKRWSRVGEWLEALLHGHGLQGLEGADLTELRIRMPREDDPMVLLIVKASTDTGRYIGFVGAGTVGQALLAWRKRDGGAGLKWKEDVPYGER